MSVVVFDNIHKRKATKTCNWCMKIEWILFQIILLFIFMYEYVAYETNEHKLHEMFRKVHPDLGNITWKDIQNLNPRTHNQLCNDVLKDIIPPGKDYNGYSYYITFHEKLEEERVIKSASLKLENETVHVTVVKCYYEEITFYVTRADDNHVFTLTREPDSGIFHLKAGLHPVQPNYTVALTFTMPETVTEEDCET